VSCKDKLIVTYCLDQTTYVRPAVVDLKAKGINNAAVHIGGFAGWQMPVTGDKKSERVSSGAAGGGAVAPPLGRALVPDRATIPDRKNPDYKSTKQ